MLSYKNIVKANKYYLRLQIIRPEMSNSNPSITNSSPNILNLNHKILTFTPSYLLLYFYA